MLQFNGLQREKCARERSQDEINRQTHVTCRLRRWLRQTTHLQSMCVLILHDTNNTNIFLLYEKLSKLKSYTRIYVEECMQQRYDVHFYLKNKNSTENKRKSDWNRNRYTTKTEKKTRINTREEEERRKKKLLFLLFETIWLYVIWDFYFDACYVAWVYHHLNECVNAEKLFTPVKSSTNLIGSSSNERYLLINLCWTFYSCSILVDLFPFNYILLLIFVVVAVGK